MNTDLPGKDYDKGAILGEPSYVWREGQARRLQMIVDAAGKRINGRILDNGCGIGSYLQRFSELSATSFGLEFDFQRAQEANQRSLRVVRARGEQIPFPSDFFDLVLSHEVLEHVSDDRASLEEIVRVLRPPDPKSDRPGGRLVAFTPNRWYPFETHGIILNDRYRRGNIPLVNYLPRPWRDRLAPHVRIYTQGDMRRLFSGLPLRVVKRTVIFGAYDNIIARLPRLGRVLRWLLQSLEKTPLRIFGLSHYWVVEKIESVKPS